MDLGKTLEHPCGVALLLVFLTGETAAQATLRSPLPSPTGPYPVGTAVWHWSDSLRFDELTPDPTDVRQIMAHPAAPEAAAEFARYAALYPELADHRSWSHPSARVADVDGALPVLVTTPGRGLPRHLYTGIAEDLASHGYFVLGVDSPHSGRVVYPDGRILRPTDRHSIPIEILTGPYERVNEFFAEAAELGAQDVAFALGQLGLLNQHDPTRRLTGRLDLSRLGLFRE